MWFAVIPEVFRFSFPTGGWDWLSFIGVSGTIVFAIWSVHKQIKENQAALIKQQELSVVPVLDVTINKEFEKNIEHQTYRTFTEENGMLSSNGHYIIMGEKKLPDEFKISFALKVQNKGLSTAFKINIFLYELKSIAGNTELEEIRQRDYVQFYEHIKYENYQYYKNKIVTNESEEPRWLLAPEYNLTVSQEGFVLYIDKSKLIPENGMLSSGLKEYHSILKFEFQDIYENKYYQLMYVYFSGLDLGFLPISGIMKEDISR